MQEIRVALAKFKTTKGFGVDNISSSFLKLALSFVENSLTIFNASIETRIFPESWKLHPVDGAWTYINNIYSEYLINIGHSIPNIQGKNPDAFILLSNLHHLCIWLR